MKVWNVVTRYNHGDVSIESFDLLDAAKLCLESARQEYINEADGKYNPFKINTSMEIETVDNDYVEIIEGELVLNNHTAKEVFPEIEEHIPDNAKGKWEGYEFVYPLGYEMTNSDTDAIDDCDNATIEFLNKLSTRHLDYADDQMCDLVQTVLEIARERLFDDYGIKVFYPSVLCE